MSDAVRRGIDADPNVQALLSSLDETAWMRARLNGVDLVLPAGTVLTMGHRLEVDEFGKIVLWVETGHLDWMRARLRPGATFLDVGAATGAMALPIAAEFPGIRIIAFEPARRALRLLRATLARNELTGAQVIDAAVADRCGILPFVELGVSLDGKAPFQPEGSCLLAGSPQSRGETIEVVVTTLDEIATTYGLDQARVVVKLDIEGFEVEALTGGARFFAANDVSIAIDIHQSPHDPAVTTEAACSAILSRYGYEKQEMYGHVLLCERAR